MSSILSGLNPAQNAAVKQMRGPVLILAGAGTGKTRVITARIAYMLKQGIHPGKILAVTFTNKAAQEMRERVAGAVPKKAAKAVTVSTFHSLCVRILRESITCLGYKKNFTIYDQSDQVGLLRRIIVRKAAGDEKLEPKLAQNLISAAKNKGIPVSEKADSLIAEVYHAYQAELKQLNAVDFDDLMLLAVRILSESSEAREKWSRRFDFMMVDEFQDTNSLQMELVQLLVKPEENNICVVGDDDQSIYGFRGAEISNILDFERFFPNPKVIKLEENYRSTNIILKLANSLIKNNAGRREKTLWSSKGDGEKPRLVGMPDEETEAEALVFEILEQRQEKKREWEDFAILFRMNTQSRLLEQALRQQDIPYRILGGQSFFEKREVKDVLAYLSLFLNPNDDVSLLRVINHPPRGIGNATVTAATEYSIQKECSIFAVLHDKEFLTTLTNRARTAVRAFRDQVDGYTELVASETLNYATMTSDLLESVGFMDYVRRNCRTPEEALAREQTVNDLLESMRMHRDKSVASGGLSDFMDSVALRQEKEDRDDGERGWGVSLITMHAAKGLEFPVVYVSGLEQGVLPHSRSIEEGGIDEERRILYVAITRAMEQLTMTWCFTRTRWGQKQGCQLSCFVDEFDDDLFEELDYEEMAAEPASEKEVEEYFNQMRQMLSG
ncbi:MAG: UvrD-helicase domain-containing protein [Verrucomicrobia bacterium]|nr:UvrD-helicase domain-containing protein [Verrucomicrobiota bacterium]